MSDREKKIAEIREALEKIDRGDFSEIAGAHEKSGEWLRFLLDELERERAAHNAHVTELCQLEEKNRKLREERDEARSKAEEAWKEIDSLEDQLQSVQQDRDKLIEGLRWYADSRNWAGDVFAPPEGIPPEVDDGGQRARDILKEIGANVE